uniref:Uncharacterized protein n=1 Tax=Heliothis virescens TaxID=7102 RepID=A0A2A4JPI9_HELVI
MTRPPAKPQRAGATWRRATAPPSGRPPPTPALWAAGELQPIRCAHAFGRSRGRGRRPTRPRLYRGLDRLLTDATARCLNYTPAIACSDFQVLRLHVRAAVTSSRQQRRPARAADPSRCFSCSPLHRARPLHPRPAPRSPKARRPLRGPTRPTPAYPDSHSLAFDFPIATSQSCSSDRAEPAKGEKRRKQLHPRAKRGFKAATPSEASVRRQIARLERPSAAPRPATPRHDDDALEQTSWLGRCALLPGRTVAAQLPRGAALPFRALLRRTAAEPADVSRVFLASLFLANAGSVEVVPGPPLSLDSFSLRLVSTEPRLPAAEVAELALC